MDLRVLSHTPVHVRVKRGQKVLSVRLLQGDGFRLPCSWERTRDGTRRRGRRSDRRPSDRRAATLRRWDD